MIEYCIPSEVFKKKTNEVGEFVFINVKSFLTDDMKGTLKLHFLTDDIKGTLKLRFKEKPDKTYIKNICSKQGKILLFDEVGSYNVKCTILHLNNKMATIEVKVNDMVENNFPFHLLFDENVDIYLAIQTLEKYSDDIVKTVNEERSRY